MKCTKIGEIKKGKLLTSHRSTTYPCFDQDLGDSAGAGRMRLPDAKIRIMYVPNQIKCRNIYFELQFLNLTKTTLSLNS